MTPKQLRQKRLSLDLTQEKMAKKMQFSPSRYSVLERKEEFTQDEAANVVMRLAAIEVKILLARIAELEEELRIARSN